MNTYTSIEKQLQNNVIDLFKSMGYTFMSQEKNVNFRNQKLFSVLLKDILVNQLLKLNNFEYKGIAYKFFPKNIANTITSLDESLSEGLKKQKKGLIQKLLTGEVRVKI